ncbi:MAG: YeeE/YedE thiosulfate transporter family protein [Saprospiraceae bacterium]|nr:YeeE/YedE thiosulfate transporter family protein [Saprospiraceae bacterium]
MIMDLIVGHWHWAFSGAAIVVIVFLLTWMGQEFGVSSVFRNICTVFGAGRKIQFFNIDLKTEYWRFAFIIGALVGGAIAGQYLMGSEPLDISQATISHLENDWGITYPQGGGLLPTSVFNLGNLKGVIIALFGGFMVGFGARYGDGCTSGHAITGLSHLQLPSLLTVIGFFIGGLAMTWLIMPLIFGA